MARDRKCILLARGDFRRNMVLDAFMGKPPCHPAYVGEQLMRHRRSKDDKLAPPDSSFESLNPALSLWQVKAER